MVNVRKIRPPSGRKPKVQVNLRPNLAKILRYLAKKERRELSDLSKEMLALWLKKHKDQHPEIELEDDD